jgi:hypothetical protein
MLCGLRGGSHSGDGGGRTVLGGKKLCCLGDEKIGWYVFLSCAI